jgi:DNA modification methylase
MQKIKITELKPYEKNARIHSKHQIDLIAASIKEYGFNNPVLINKDKMIIAGHGRVEAAKKLGLEVVPCVMLEHLNKKQQREYILADNRLAELAEWDFEILAGEIKELDIDAKTLGFDSDFLKQSLKNPGKTDDDYVPEPLAPVAKLGDIWILGHHRLMCGDSTSLETVEKLMDGERADMVFTDPPYGVSYADKNKYLNAISPANRIQKEIENDHMDIEKTSEFIYKCFVNIKTILADRSNYYITAPQGSDLMMMMMMKAELPLRHCLIWIKNNHVLGRTDYNYKHEPILYGWDKVHDFYGQGEHRFSTWEIAKPLKNDLHPTMKPIALIENAILNSTKSRQIVADIFGGSGSTLIACEKTGRKCYMMEIDPVYCDVTIKRWEEYTGEKAKLHA